MLLQFLGLLITHYIADFVCQSHWMASNKSKDNVALLSHVVVYTIILFIASVAMFSPLFVATPIPAYIVVQFVLLNGVAHYFTDYVTSRITSRLYEKKDWHNFFVVIGLDQLIHQLTLAGTMIWLLG